MFRIPDVVGTNRLLEAAYLYYNDLPIAIGATPLARQKHVFRLVECLFSCYYLPRWSGVFTNAMRLLVRAWHERT